MTSIKEMAKKLEIPYHFLAKILQSLAHKGLLTSLKGPTGGFSLGMPAKDITLFHIVEAIDGVDFMNKCVLGFPDCSEVNPCPVHNQWGNLREDIYKMLISKNIERMAQEMKKPQYE